MNNCKEQFKKWYIKDNWEKAWSCKVGEAWRRGWYLNKPEGNNDLIDLLLLWNYNWITNPTTYFTALEEIYEIYLKYGSLRCVALIRPQDKEKFKDYE